jgi:O-antigen/teichoic acid export membrane protein
MGLVLDHRLDRSEAAENPLPRAVAASIAGKLAEMATLVALATIVPRSLGPSDYGRFATALTIVTLGSLALTLGGPTTMARFVPAVAETERAAVARRLTIRFAAGRALQVLALAAVAVVLVLAQPDQFGPVPTAMVVVALALNVAASVGLQAGLGLGRTVMWSARFPVQNTVLVAGTLVAPRFGGDNAALAAIVVSAAVAAGLGAVVAVPVLRDRAVDIPLPAGAVRFGVLHAAGAALTQATQRGGILVAALVASDREAGYAALALGVSLGAVYAVLQTFTVSLPHLAVGRHGEAAAEFRLRGLAVRMLAVLTPVLVAIAAATPHVVSAVFGSGYAAADAAFAPAWALVALSPLTRWRCRRRPSGSAPERAWPRER